jgi:hypothetical protein
MSRLVTSVKEWINPGWVVHGSVPPMDAGLRPNSVLDDATELLAVGEHEPDDVVALSPDLLWFSSGNAVWKLEGLAVEAVAQFSGQVSAIARRDADVVAAIEGHGLVSIERNGRVRDMCTDETVASCVTDLTSLPDETLLATVGSARVPSNGWASALVECDHTGCLVRIADDRAQLVAEDLPWPSGIAPGDGKDILLSLSLGLRVERRALTALSEEGTPILSNLPAYPGRIRRGRTGWWVAAPYVRNRGTELILDEPKLRRELVASIMPSQWPVPRLRSENPYTEPLQLGQLRVLGVLKPWAPPRAYGLLFLLGSEGRVVRSFHSRVDGNRHGVTGVTEGNDRLIVAVRGGRTLLELRGA